MKYIRKSFKDRIPYYSAMITDGIILNANEACYETPKEIKDFITSYINECDLRRYPDTDCLMLKEEIAKRYNVSINNVICGVGSDQLLDCIFRSIIEDENIVIGNPTFSMYKEYSSYTKGNVIEVKYNEDFTYNTKEILVSIDKYNPKLVIICTPNNPTGSIMERNDVIEVINKTNGVVVIDEAYGEFADESLIDLATKYDNVIVLKTFSKAFALAGIRVGYAISSSDNIDTLNVVKPPYNLSSLSIAASSYAIRHKELYADNIKMVKHLREELYKELKALNIEVYPSKANFLWMCLNEKIVEKLKEEKIYIRKLMYNNNEYYRITVGNKEENQKLLEIIKEALV